MTENAQNAIRSYRPGGWYAIFGEHASVLLPESEKPRVAALWELVDSEAGFDELLDALIATGLRSLPGFVLVSTAEEPTRIVLRGSARAEVTLGNGERASVDGGAAATWVEKALSDVASLQLVLEDDGEAVDFGIRGGLVRASRVDQPPYAERSGDASEGAAADAPAAVSSDAGAVPVADDERQPESPAGSDESPVEPAESSAAGRDTAGEDSAPVGGAYAAPVVGAFSVGAVGGAHAAEQREDEQSSNVEQSSDVEPASYAEPAAYAEPEAEPVHAEPASYAEPEAESASYADEQEAESVHAAEGTEGAAFVDEQPTEAHAFPFFNDPEPDAAQVEPEADAQHGAEGTPGAPGGQGAAPSEPIWGQAPQGNVYTPPEAPSNPFAGAESAEPPMWTPPEQQQAPQWGAPADTPAWGEQPDQGNIDHDGHTQAGNFNSGEFARQHPGIPGQPQAPSVTAQPVAKLVFSNGETVDVDRAVLVGRAPEARRFTSTDQPRLVTVTSPNQEISSTHLEVRPGSGVDHGSAIVTDMGSTNGTVLTQPGFAPEDLQPGIAVQLLPGSVIDLGDGVTIQVTSV
ncbi:FHA domain-containing protein [Nocardioides sp. JQ2195]|uniref:FHA domain-containing protein n=1 Tax=Nocardioides sp. JQ2195 TaxID=2592334 RepID=UPI00143E2AAA|nr:FHA domain-containing protein [Nocardioides sp. JQ2195]QIX25732.1 FHA domain-containing protein [Nocardioides sp. JQ2195]